jgi:hypothetical protein
MPEERAISTDQMPTIDLVWGEQGSARGGTR